MERRYRNRELFEKYASLLIVPRSKFDISFRAIKPYVFE